MARIEGASRGEGEVGGVGELPREAGRRKGSGRSRRTPRRLRPWQRGELRRRSRSSLLSGI